MKLYQTGSLDWANDFTSLHILAICRHTRNTDYWKDMYVDKGACSTSPEDHIKKCNLINLLLVLYWKLGALKSL